MSDADMVNFFTSMSGGRLPSEAYSSPPVVPKKGVLPTPMVWPETTLAALALNQQESVMHSDCAVTPCPSGKCDKVLQIGIFFDGTNNNRERDEPDRGHTNVVRLFNAHPDVITGRGDLKKSGYYSYYIPGVGTRFPENHEWRESADGKSQGTGAFERVVYGVYCVFNGIHRYLKGNQDLCSTKKMYLRLRRFLPQDLTEANKKLAEVIKSSNKKNGGLSLMAVRVNVFGFSRGAAQAVAFCDYLSYYVPRAKIADIPIRINFVGLFDCVASMGIADSARRMIFSLGPTGHGGGHDIGEHVTTPLPAIVRQAVHLVAAHEQRMNFPVDLVSGGNMQTFIYPGVHSDLGGGYGLKGQGRDPDEGTMLSQLPLMHMYKLARMNGVDLATPAQIVKDSVLSKDFALDSRLPKAWNAYMVATDQDFRSGGAPALNDCKDAPRLIRQHMRMRYDQLKKYNNGKAAYDKNLLLPLGPQDQEDLCSAIRQLNADLWMLQAYFQTSQGVALEGENLKIYNQWYKKCDLAIQNLFPMFSASSAENYDASSNPKTASQMPHDYSWLKWAFEELRHVPAQKPVKETGHWDLLHRYVHDSIAGFYMVGYSTAAEKAEALQAMVEKRNKGEKLTEHEKTVLKNYDEKIKTDSELKQIIRRRVDAKQLNMPADDYERQYAYSREEANYVDSSGVFPVLSDKDEPVLLSTEPRVNRVAVPLVTNTRREGGGYLFPRVVFVSGKPIGLIS